VSAECEARSTRREEGEGDYATSRRRSAIMLRERTLCATAIRGYSDGGEDLGRGRSREKKRLSGGTYCFLISRICEPCNLSLNNGSLIIAGAGVARG
jgi:hypothetical protein